MTPLLEGVRVIWDGRRFLTPLEGDIIDVPDSVISRMPPAAFEGVFRYEKEI